MNVEFVLLFYFFYFQRFWQFEDLGHNEDEKIINAIDKIVEERFIISGSRKFAKANEKKVKKTVADFLKNIKIEAKNYSGPPSGKPKVPGYLGTYRKKLEVAANIREAFIQQVFCFFFFFCLLLSWCS
jgi:hypothetical protein